MAEKINIDLDLKTGSAIKDTSKISSLQNKKQSLISQKQSTLEKIKLLLSKKNLHHAKNLKIMGDHLIV